MKYVSVRISIFLCVVAFIIIVGERGWRANPAPCLPNANRPLRIGYVPWAGYAGGVLSNDGFSSETAEFINFSSYEEARAALLEECVCPDRGIDALVTSIQTWAVQFDQLKQGNKFGIKVRAIAAVTRSRDACAIVGADGVTVSQLGNRDLVVPEFSPADWLAKQIVADPVIDRKASSQDALDAFLDRKFKAVGLCEPELHYASGRPGAHPLDASVRKDITYILVARDDTINQFHPRLASFIKNWLYAQKSFPRLDTIKQLFRNRPSIGYDHEGQPITDGKVDDLVTREWEHTRPVTELENVNLFGREKSIPAAFDGQFRQSSQDWGLNPAPKPEDARDSSIIQEIYSQSFPVPALSELCQPHATITKEDSAVIRFDPGSFEIKRAEDQDRLKHMADVLMEVGDKPQSKQACIVGHTDSTLPEKNSALSRNRAEEIAKYLYRAGLVQDRVITDWKADSRPVASNKTEKGRAMNRRVEITIVREGKE
jgi:outer membrane protein OmpA-like peptidoglycan-associated protein